MIREHFLTTAQPDLWNKHLPSTRSVFGSVGYARICEAFRDCSPRLYVVESDRASICYPLWLRSLTDLPFRVATSAKWDTTTPEFTGPLVFGDDPEFIAEFPHFRDAFFRKEGVVAEFARLHPWSLGRTALQDGCIYSRDVVWVDVALDPDHLWREHFQPACRKNINRAEREGVKIRVASDDQYIREFYRIYCDTMERNDALATYRFSYEFFQAFREELPENSRFVFAEYRDQIVAATLYLYDDNDVVSFLGGADVAFQHVRPTNAVIWQTIRWAHATGKKRLNLGGGYQPEDGIFRFKSTFSPLRQPYYIYQRIHLEQDYALLDSRCREHNGLNGDPVSYFPSYRCLVSDVKQTPQQPQQSSK